MSDQPPSLPSLMDELGDPGDAASSKARPPRDPKQIKRIKGALAGLGGLAIGGAMVWGVLVLLPVPKPDYETGDIGDVLGYTLLTTEFDQLPLEERIDLIGQVVKRLESMDAQEGTLMAAFAAGIAGEARQQLEANAAGVVIDMWDQFAPGYQRISDPAEQEAYLEEATVGFIRLMERMDGDPTDKTDEEILADARAQVQRDKEVFTDPMRGPSTSGVARMVTFINREIGDRASPQQRARIGKLSRDMTRYLRGEDMGGN